MDALLDFHPAPSNEELRQISECLRAVFDEQGFAAGQQQAEAVLREYPSCGQLKVIVGGLYFHFLSSALSRAADPEQVSESLIARCLALFEQGESESEMENEKLGARLLRINTLTILGRYAEAEALIDSLPAKQPIDTDVLRINLHLAQERLDEAAQLSRKQLLTHVHEVLSALMMLTTAARRQKDFPSAHRYWDALCAIDKLFSLDRSNDLLIGILLAQDEGSTEQALDLFEQYIDAQLAYTLDYRQNPFFAGTQTRVPTQNEIAEMRRLMLRSIETDGQFTLIQDESRFRAAVERFRAAIPPEA